MPKDYGELNFDKIFDKLDKMADKISKSGENIENAGEQAAQQLGIGFEDGIEDATSKILASSLKINKAFKDLAKKITNQKDIFNISLNGKNVVLDIDFSDIDINSADFQRKIDEVFENFKIDNVIEFDSKDAEKQFKDMLALHTKYAVKLSKLQEQRPKLTSQASIKANAQAQLAIVDGLREIQKILDQTSGMSIELPHVHFGDTKELRTSINLIEQMEKGEEKVGKQRDTNTEKIRKENKELKERNRLLEEKAGPIEEGEIPPARKSRTRKPKEPSEADIVRQRGEEMKAFVAQFEGLQKELGDTSKWFDKFNDFLNQIQQGSLTAAEAVAKLREGMAGVEKKKQLNQGSTGTQQEIKSQEELQKEIEDTNRVIKIQKQWLEYLDPVLDDENFKTSGKREATEQLRSNTSHLVDVRRHPEQYDHLEMYSEKAEVAWAKAYKEAERQGVAQSTLNRYYTDAGYAYDENIKKLQEERTWHAKILEDEESKLAVLQQQMQAETNIEKVRKHNLSRTINGKSGKFGIKNITYETDSGQMSMFPGAKEDVETADDLVEANEKVAKSRKKVTDAVDGTQMTIDDIMPASAEDTTPKVEKEADALDKVGKAAEKTAGSKKKFAKANKEVAASVTPSVEGLETEADAMEDVGEAAKKTNRVISEEAKHAAESMNFSTRDYEKLYDEMEAFAEQRKAENGYDLSRVSVNTDAHGNPLGATISYYKKATKETITETFKIDKAAQEAEEGVNRLILSSRKATAGIADFEKATLQAINRQDQLIAQKNKTVSSLSAVLDPNSNRSLAGTDYEEEANRRIQEIKDEVAKLDQVDSAGERIILPEKDFLAIKRRIAELTQDARDFINQSKNAEYAPTQLESHSVSSGNQYREDQLKAQINEWKRAGIYVGDLKKKADELAKSVTKITKHEDLKKYLEGMKEARALAKLSTQDKKAEEERQKKLNEEYKEYIKLIEKRDAIESKMVGLDAVKNRDELAALQADYDAVDNEFNSKYGDFLSRKDVQEHFSIDDLAYADDAARRKMAVRDGKISDKKRLEEEAAAQKKVNDTYKEYINLINLRGKYQKELVGLDPEKDRENINRITADINEVDEKLNTTYGDLLSNKIAQATLTLEDFMKYYDKWQREIADKEAKAADKARNAAEKPYRDYGKTTANSAVRKRDNLRGEIDALGVTNPEILAKIDVYNAKVQEVVDLRAKFENDPEAAKDPALVKQFQKASAEAERVRRGIKVVIDEEQRLIQLSEEQGFDPIELSADQMVNLENEMIAHAKATAQGRVEIKGWNADHTKMNYTVTNSKGVVEEMTIALGQGRNTMYQYRTATKETGTLIEQVFKGIKVKAKELLSFVIGGGSVYKIIELLRQGIQYVREIDLALTELKKVTDETEESYDRFLETAANTGAKLGSTISAVTEATATFAKLGYSMKQATEMAEAAIVYKNVGDNIASTEDAADSIISTMKGFKLEATESMAIVDRFNEVGNRFAITSQGIGEALRLSASALSEGGNSLDESIGLITAANEVVNDPSSVGTALKTLTLRLRGSKTELEEMGEDVSDMATTTSALQAKLLALTGGQVDIMLDENTFKNSTQILREMAEAWEDMTDIQRASALELMGGKRQANVLSALIQNFDTVEEAIEASANSAGSALKENERYLDSIQGKIDQFNNALQSMWSDTLDSDLVKWFVGLGTELVKIVDAIGLIPSILAAILTYKLAIGAIKMFDLTSLGTYISMLFMANSATEVQGLLINKTALAQKLLNSTLIQAQVARMNLTAADLAGYTVTQLLGLGIKGLIAGFKNLWIAMGPVGWAIVGITVALTASITIFNAINKTTEELKEELDGLKTELSNIRSELDSINSELETTNERMAELLAKDKLTFEEQEELDRLRKTNDELERRKELLEDEEELKANRVGRQAARVVNSAKEDKTWWQTAAWVASPVTGVLVDGAAGGDAESKVGANIKDYSKIKSKLDNASSLKKQNKYKKKLDKEAEKIDEYILELAEALDGVEYGDSEESDAALDYLSELQDTYAIARGSESAKTNAIKGLLNKDEFSETKTAIDGYVDALAKGDADAATHIDEIINKNTDLVEDLNVRGLEAQDAVDYFTKLGSEANYATIDGKIQEVSRAATTFESLLDGGLFKVDDVDIGLAELFDEEGKIIQTKLSQVFNDTSDQTREDITRLLEGSYDQIKNETVDTERLLTGFGLKAAQQVLDIQNKILGEQNIELFPNLKDEINGIIDTFGEFSKAVGGVVDALDALDQARAEEAYSGSISIETLENLMKYTDDYAQLVEIDETGAIRLAADAEEILINQRLEKIKTDAAAAVQTAQANLAQAEYNAKAVNETSPVQEALTSATDALAGSWAFLGSLIGDVTGGNFSGMLGRASDAYKKSTAGREEKRAQVNVSVEDAKEALDKALDQQKIANAITSENVKTKYSADEASGGNKTKEEVEDDAFQREMDYWENRIAANQAKYGQLQNEIDLLESRGQKAGAEYYKEQMKLEEGRLRLLNQQKMAAKSHLSALEEGSDEWWEVANVLNGIQDDLDDVTASIVDLQDAIGDIETYKFEEFNTRLDNLAGKLGTIRDLIAPDGEEDWFDEEGGWTEKGVAALGTYTQELEFFKHGYQNTVDEIAKYQSEYAGNEDYYETLGIHSEQELYDKQQDLIDQQYDYSESISNSEQSIVDMYESGIDATEEYFDTLVDSYNDYIDSVKDALDAERD